MRITLRCSLILFTGLFVLCFLYVPTVNCQTPSPLQAITEPALRGAASPSVHATDGRKDEGTRLAALEDAVRDQHAQLEDYAAEFDVSVFSLYEHGADQVWRPRCSFPVGVLDD